MVTNSCTFSGSCAYPHVYMAGLAVSKLGNSSVRYWGEGGGWDEVICARREMFKREVFPKKLMLELGSLSYVEFAWSQLRTGSIGIHYHLNLQHQYVLKYHSRYRLGLFPLLSPSQPFPCDPVQGHRAQDQVTSTSGHSLNSPSVPNSSRFQEFAPDPEHQQSLSKASSVFL